ncbi:hypothetical protein [Rosenbergiella metrosideri]|uniref:hypothetical protein n=1 Tax=Rosenbergiella metrosideri TaxID=2921185 RepID=UPI001F4F7FE4|nr:hypothetical protein [Rosenbergiella metrosideri]
MIALTQEKRQKRIDWLKGRISSMEQCRDEIPFGLSEDESMELSAYKDSLSSLTAGKLSKDASESLIAMVEYSLSHRICMGMDEGFKSFDPVVEHDFVQEIRDFIASGDSFFTAPPVPEIKLPDDDLCEEGLKKHGLRTKSEGISQLSDGFRCGFAWHENEIKRLNGLGE